MWDNSTLPMYDGSLTSNIILITLYLRLILYYIVLAAGIIFMVCLIFSPFIISYYGIKTLKIKIKNSKKYRHKNNRNKERESDQTVGYLSRLENNISKKNEKNKR